MKNIIDSFHNLFYNSLVWTNTYWLGVPVLKYPQDLWIYQEIVFELKPDLIVECGTSQGGSALFLATICDLIGKGKVVTIDIVESPTCPQHNRITYLLGSSTSPEIVQAVRQEAKDALVVMVILDSDHSKQHVSNELQIYSQLVTKGSYLIVEDTNINGNPVLPGSGPGPREAVEEFMAENDQFVIDYKREKFYVTSNPNGFLRKIK
jgi:cephalosporin hydroxylase